MGIELSPDSIIVAEAFLYSKENDIEFVTDDINCKNIAKNIFGLSVTSVSNLDGDIYKGYIQIEGTTDEINDKMLALDYDNICVNEYCIIHNLDDNKWSEMRYNGKVFETLRLPSSKAIKGKNSLQRCALDALLFAGDYAQSLFNKTSTNPLVKMCEEFKNNPNFACVVLDEDVRSSTSKMFANLFKG